MMIKFEYFEEPENFSYMHQDEILCDICASKTQCFDTAGYYGKGALSAVCPECLSKGLLEDHELSANDVSSREGDLREELDFRTHAKIIIYQTPKLPVWQDMAWPIHNGDFCRFIKIASRTDFENPADLSASIHPNYDFGHEEDELWEMLEPKPIRNIAEAQNDISFYLFEAGNQKVVTWQGNRT